jgi:hypothetical protein
MSVEETLDDIITNVEDIEDLGRGELGVEKKPKASAWAHAAEEDWEHPKVVVMDNDMVTIIQGEHLDHMVHELLVNHDQCSVDTDI